MSEIIDWLLEGDPAIVFQVHRDLLNAAAARCRSLQARIAEQGWGAQLLAKRDRDGRWGHGLYSPKWTSTTYTLLELRRLGLAPSNRLATASANLLLSERVWMRGRLQDYWEACIAGFGLQLASWFGANAKRRDALLAEVLDAQMPDGGWNCRSPRGATHSSFHTTINVLEGLQDYAQASSTRRHELMAAQRRAREFFCAHQLYRSHRTGKVVDSKMTRMSFPPRWRHDVMRTLDYFQASRADRDVRLEDPIAVLRDARQKDGRWLQQTPMTGTTWHTMERVGQASRWNTLRALRILRWWNGGSADPARWS